MAPALQAQFNTPEYALDLAMVAMQLFPHPRLCIAAATLMSLACAPHEGAAPGPLLRERTPAQFIDAASLRGQLTQRSNCLVMGNVSVVWPSDAELLRTGDGNLVVRSARSNSSVRVGSAVRLMGGESHAAQPQRWENLDETRRPPPYWVTGQFSPEPGS